MSNNNQNLLFTSVDESLSFQTLYGEKHQELVRKLKQFITQETSMLAFICGEKSSGKTHLLRASCHFVIDENQQNITAQAFYIKLSQFDQALAQSMIDFIEQNQETPLLIALDDVDELESLPRDEQKAKEMALLSVYEALKHQKIANQHKLLLASKNTPINSIFILKDLKTRLATSIIYPMKKLNDEDKMRVFQTISEVNGLQISEEKVSYLFHHYSRDMQDLKTLIVELDALSLKEHKKISIALIKSAIDKLK